MSTSPYHQPQRNLSQDAEYVRLTERGFPSAFKEAFFARYNSETLTRQKPFLESLNLSSQVLADIWLPASFPPASFEPLSEDEIRAASSGQFSMPPKRQQGNSASIVGQQQQNNEFGGRRGGDRDGRRFGSTGSRGGKTANIPRRFQRPSSHQQPEDGSDDFSTYQQHHQNQQHHHHHYDMEAEPEWETPSAEAMTSAFGTFDENGVFRAAVDEETFMGSGGIVNGSFDQSQSQLQQPQLHPGHYDFFSGFPVNPISPHASVPVPVQAVTPPKAAIPMITPETLWFYRDPSGQIQGPFPSNRMLEWYNGNYFPENLPLRREQDPFFEPLSTWKMKCAGQIPFSSYTLPTPVTEPVPVVASTSASATSFSLRSFSSKASAVTSPSAVVNEEDWFNQVVQQPTTSPSNSSVLKSVTMESLFSGSIPSPANPNIQPQKSTQVIPDPAVIASTKPVKEVEGVKSPELVEKQQFFESLITSGAGGAGWKKLDKPQPVNIVDELNREVEKKLSVSEGGWTAKSPAASPLSDILKEQEVSVAKNSPASASVPVTASMPVPVSASSSSSSASNASWAKKPTSPIQPLAKILQEDEQEFLTRQQQQARAAASAAAASSGPKSFADLVRTAGTASASATIVKSASAGVSANKSSVVVVVSGGGGSAASLLASNVPVVEESWVTVGNKATGTTTTTTSSTTTSSTNTSSTNTSKPSTVDLSKWCQATLAKTPLASSIDPLTCTTLLLDLPNGPSVLSFIQETLLPMLPSNAASFDSASFAKEFVERKFGSSVAAKLNYSGLSGKKNLAAMPLQAEHVESEFETVGRRKSNNPSRK